MIGLSDISDIIDIYSYIYDYTESTSLQDMGFDELDWYDMIMKLEKKFHIRFTEEEDRLFNYLGDIKLSKLIEIINNKLAVNG